MLKQNIINLNKLKIKSLKLAKAGRYVVFFKNLDGRFVFELMSANIHLDIYGLFIGKNKDQYKVETIQYHKAPSSTSNLLIKGVFDDESKFYYQGLIRIEKKAQKSHAYQKNQNLILSPNTYVESKPYLEILANDVFCTHGSTTGKLNEDELYYMQTRGLNKSIARELYIDGFIADIFDKIKKTSYD
ncbi:SufD family Fe-S cluster assembly protein [Candidatus Roizmanbacteria bacterium]|nr:SufD family Fe-S cluster assembly protein [Candidatus Roizmanbacteria bacterium]